MTIIDNHSDSQQAYDMGMKEMQIFTNNLRALIDESNISMLKLEKRSGVTRTHIKNILDGERQVTILRAGMIASAFGLRLTDMLKEQLPSAGTARESLLLDGYRNLSETDKDVVDRVARSLPGKPRPA